MEGDFITIVFLFASFIVLIITGSIAANAASDITKKLQTDPKLDSAHTLLRTGANVGLGIGVTGLIISILALLILAAIPGIAELISVIPGKPYIKIFYGVLTTILGFMAGIQAAIAVSDIKNSDTYNNSNISTEDKTALDSAISAGQTAAGLFLGITSLILIIFIGMAIYDYYKELRKEKINFEKESLIYESEIEKERINYEYNRRIEEARLKALEEQEKRRYDIQNAMLDQVLDKVKRGEISSRNAEKIKDEIENIVVPSPKMEPLALIDSIEENEDLDNIKNEPIFT